MSDSGYKKYLLSVQEREMNRIDNIIRDKENEGFVVKKTFKNSLKISKDNASISQMEKNIEKLQSVGKRDINKNMKAFYYYDDDGNMTRLKIKRGKSVFAAGLDKIKKIKDYITWDGESEIKPSDQTDYDMQRLFKSMIIKNPNQHSHYATDYGCVVANTVSNNLRKLYDEYLRRRAYGGIPKGFEEKVHDALSDYNFDSEQEYVMESTVEKLYLALTGTTKGLENGSVMQGEQISLAGTPYE